MALTAAANSSENTRAWRNTTGPAIRMTAKARDSRTKAWTAALAVAARNLPANSWFAPRRLVMSRSRVPLLRSMTSDWALRVTANIRNMVRTLATIADDGAAGLLAAALDHCDGRLGAQAGDGRVDPLLAHAGAEGRRSRDRDLQIARHVLHRAAYDCGDYLAFVARPCHAPLHSDRDGFAGLQVL